KLAISDQKDMETVEMRRTPNIIMTGTPGVGKTTHSELLSQKTGLRHLSINHIVKDKGCYEGWDEEYSSWLVDEDRVSAPGRAERRGPLPSRRHIVNPGQLLDSIEDDVRAGGCVIDWHACDLFPQSWIDLVVVLRVN